MNVVDGLKAKPSPFCVVHRNGPTQPCEDCKAARMAHAMWFRELVRCRYERGAR